MRNVYSQKQNTLTIDGVTMQDYMDGASIIVTYDGGEVDKTQGTDGAGINIATEQGMTIQFTLREDSRSRAFLESLHRRQEESGGVTVIFRSGVNVLYSMSQAFIGLPGPLNTGDKKQGGIQYTVMSATCTTDNLERDLDASEITSGVLLS